MLTSERQRGQPGGQDAAGAEEFQLDWNESFELSGAGSRTVLAVGGELKNALCLVRGGQALLSEPLGALDDSATCRRFAAAVDGLWHAHGGDLDAIACDAHPLYFATRYVERYRGRVQHWIPVQHHHAHALAALAEHGVTDPAVAIVCDGTGYGTDGAIWGGEVLWVHRSGFARCGQIEYFALVGGDAAAQQTWRPALSLARMAFGAHLPTLLAKRFDAVDPSLRNVADTLLTHHRHTVPTSSLGRLFDAVAFLLDLADANDVEGQAAMRVEAAAESADEQPAYAIGPVMAKTVWQLPHGALLKAMVDDLARGVDRTVIARRFHATVAALFMDVAMRALSEHAPTDTVVLSGGCFLNQILTRDIKARLAQAGVGRILTHQRLSPGDASLALGQAQAAAWQIAAAEEEG